MGRLQVNGSDFRYVLVVFLSSAVCHFVVIQLYLLRNFKYLATFPLLWLYEANSPFFFGERLT